MRWFLFWLSVGAAGCGGSDDEGFVCDMASREGTYLLTYTERSGGTCGTIDPGIVRIGGSGDGSLSIDCTHTAEPETSADQCDYSSSIACLDEGAGLITEGTAITTQRNERTITGVATMLIRDAATGDPLCASTYDMRYERQ